MSLKNHLWLLCVPPLLAGCARTVETQSARPAPTAIMATACSTPDVTLDTEFLTGNIASCEPLGDTELSISIEPEDAPPINCSAWYAFRRKRRKPLPST